MRASYVLAIGSDPTDELGMTLAASLMRHAHALKLRAQCISVRQGPDQTQISGDPDVVILHNLPHDCHQVRAQVCRDWLEWYDDSFRVLVAAGCDPYTFAHRRLSYPVDSAIYLRGERHEDV
jgi:hypothetical protein